MSKTKYAGPSIGAEDCTCPTANVAHNPGCPLVIRKMQAIRDRIDGKKP